MAGWKSLKETLIPKDPLRLMAKRSPQFYQRYVGNDDEFGFKLKTYARWEPFFSFLCQDYFKVRTLGMENIPSDGPALLVGNHSGLLPIDGVMISMSMLTQHPAPRRIRYLITDWFMGLPGVREWMIETGQVRATRSNAISLLERGELVGVYPEGLRGVGKPFRERYRLIDFHPGFVQLAIAMQVPIIPVATVGGDEIFPMFGTMKSMARLLRFPFFPITPSFPWLPFPLMFVPLPVRWTIKVGQPIRLDYPPEKANDRKLTTQIAREIQYAIQRDLNKLLDERKSIFTGWKEKVETRA
jgi:1-acyl-sn-glycerol-3-phosphate acyltransferase